MSAGKAVVDCMVRSALSPHLSPAAGAARAGAAGRWPQGRRAHVGDELDLARVELALDGALDGREALDGGRADALAEQLLREQATEGVPDDDRGLVETRDQLGIVFGDLVDAEVGDRVGIVASVSDGRRLVGPSWRLLARPRKSSIHACQLVECSHSPWMKTTGLVMSAPCRSC